MRNNEHIQQGDKKGVQRPLPAGNETAVYDQLTTDIGPNYLGRFTDLQHHPATRQIRQATVLQMQRQYGNVYTTHQIQRQRTHSQPGMAEFLHIEQKNLAAPAIQRTHFSSQFTSWSVLPHERTDRSAAPTFTLNLRVNAGMEVSLLSEEIDVDAVRDLIADTLNQFGGGWRDFGDRRVYVNWELNWVAPMMVQSGRALGIAVLPEESFSDSGADGIFIHEDRLSRVVLRGGAAERVLRRETRSERRSRRAQQERTRARRRFGHEVTHEIGHAMGLEHQEGTVMNDTNEERFDRQLSAEQIRQIVLNITTDPSTLPEWLRGG